MKPVLLCGLPVVSIPRMTPAWIQGTKWITVLLPAVGDDGKVRTEIAWMSQICKN